MNSNLTEKETKDGEFFLKAKYLDIQTGHRWVIIIHENDAKVYGLRAGDALNMKWNHKKTEVGLELTNNLVQPGEAGLLRDTVEKYKIKEGEVIGLSLASAPSSLECIQKKLKGKKLTYQEAKSIILDIVHYHLDDIQIAFFVASAFGQGVFSFEEIYYLTKAMAETGEMIHWDGIVADKHSIGGVPGNRTTPIVVSIISSLGIKIPKTSSRAITSEAGTADVIEAISPVEFSSEKIKEIVEKTNACLAWGGSLNLAPADDRILKVSYELGIEPYSKMIISIMAKKVAMGATHLVIDMPIGPGLKINNSRDVRLVKRIFEYLAKKFNIKIKVIVTKINGPVGQGIGPMLEIRDILRVLSQTDNRPLDLEKRALDLTGALLELTGKAKRGQGTKMALGQLKNGEALEQFRKIIRTQGGINNLSEESLKLGEYQYEFKSPKSGTIKTIDNLNLIRLARLLGSPITKEAGVYLNKIIGNKVLKGETLFTLYTNSDQRLNLAIKDLDKNQLYAII
ncbi:MAG: thymidine phosphorylase [Minisyncoccia bacterium]